MALILPAEDLAAVLSTLDLAKLGAPIWKVQKWRSGYNVTIFWRNAENPSCLTPFNARYHGGEGVNHRKQHSWHWLEAYLKRKRMNKEPDTVMWVLLEIQLAQDKIPSGLETPPVPAKGSLRPVQRQLQTIILCATRSRRYHQHYLLL